MGHRLLICIIVIIISSVLEAQPPSFRNLTNADGLSENWVRRVIQDGRGFIWIATSDGLNRYDGHEVEVFKHSENVSNSLTHNDIYTLALDENQDVLVATWGGGICKFDYVRQCFIRYNGYTKNGNSFRNSLIKSIYPDQDNMLWICTYGDGLFHFNSKTDSATQLIHNQEDMSSLQDNLVSKIVRDDEGFYWVGTLNAGLSQLRLEGDRYHFNRMEKTVGKHVYQLMLASNGDLWAATGGNGLVRMRKNAETFDYQLFTHDEVDQNTLSSDYIASIEEDHLGRIWVGSGGSGVNRFLPESNTFKRYDLKFQQPHVLTVFDTWDIYEDSSQNLWVGTGEDGVYLYDATKDVFRPHRNRGYNEYGEITSNKLRNLYEDSDGNIWVGTFTGGVSIYSSHNSSFELYKSYQNDPKSLPHNSVTAFAERPDGKVWVGTDGGGLGLFNVQDRTFERYMRHDPSDDGSLGTNAILSMLYDSQDNLWVGTWGGGLHRFNELTQSFDQFKVDPTNPHSLISNKVWEIVEDKQHRLWIATLQGGLHLFDKDKGEFTAFYTLTDDSRLPDQNVWTVYKDHEGTIWVGTEMLYEVIEHQDGIRFKAYVPDSKDPCRNFSNRRVTEIFQDSRGTLWVAYSGTGLCRLDKSSGCMECLNLGQDRIDGNIAGILEVEDALWFSSNTGISRYNLKDQSLVHFDRRSGLQGNIFTQKACLRSRGGLLFFGGTNGMNVFDPSHIELDVGFPKLVFTDFKVFNKSVPIGNEPGMLPEFIGELEEVALTHDQGVFSIHFSALEYGAPEKIGYAYKLEGFERDWSYVDDQRAATYTNLDPGNYTFKVRSTNIHGAWNDMNYDLEISIAPPFYQTKLFRGLMILLIATTLYTIHRVRIRHIQATKHELETNVHERTRQLSAEVEFRKQTEIKLNQTVNELKDTQSKLIHTEKLASIGGFVSGIAHELNNPLNYIQGGLNILEKNEPSVDQNKQGLDLIREGFRRSNEIVRNLTSISFNHTKDAKQYSIDRLINNVLAGVQPEMPDDVSIVLDLNLSGQAIEMYPEMLHTGIGNILKNAVEALSVCDALGLKKEIRIKSFKELTAQGELAVICIYNTGAQIPTHDIHRIFDPFYTTKDPGEGTGLGLAVAFYFVTQHEGMIEVENYDKGVSFNISIPIKPGSFINTPL